MRTKRPIILGKILGQEPVEIDRFVEKKRRNLVTGVVLPLLVTEVADSFVKGFSCVLYDTAFFCYPLPQFAGVNLTLRCRC